MDQQIIIRVLPIIVLVFLLYHKCLVSPGYVFRQVIDDETGSESEGDSGNNETATEKPAVEEKPTGTVGGTIYYANGTTPKPHKPH